MLLFGEILGVMVGPTPLCVSLFQRQETTTRMRGGILGHSFNLALELGVKGVVSLIISFHSFVPGENKIIPENRT